MFTNSIADLLDRFTDNMRQIRRKQEADKVRLRREWEETKRMPRKLKKRRRKEISSAWTSVDYDVFGGISEEKFVACLSMVAGPKRQAHELLRELAPFRIEECTGFVSSKGYVSTAL